MPESTTNQTGSWPNMYSAQTPRPLSMRSIVAANVTAVIVIAISVTGVLSIFQSTAIGLRLAVTINPPAPTSTNIRYISQDWMADDFGGLIIAAGLEDVGALNRGGDLSRLWRKQEEGENDDDQALSKAEGKEGRLGAGLLDHRLGWRAR